MISHSLKAVLHLFETGFSDFFTEIEEQPEEEIDAENRMVYDKKNMIYSPHHFPKSLSLEEGQIKFHENMKRRCERLYQRLAEAGTLLIICNRVEPIDSLREFLTGFSRLYPHLKIRLIVIRDRRPCWYMRFLKYTKRHISISDKVSLIIYCFSDQVDPATGDKFGWKGNAPIWDRILSKYSLTGVLPEEQCFQDQEP